MLEDGPEPEPAPVEEPWDQFMERVRRQEQERDAARVRIVERAVEGGIFRNGRRVEYNPVTQTFREV